MSLLGRWKKVQQELKQKLNIPRISNVTLSLKSKPYVIGLDISYIKDNKTKAVCTGVLMQYDTCNVVDKETREVQIIYEYHAGFLAFRELDSYIMVYQNLMTRNLDKLDQIAFVMLDGNGILHPRGFGLACSN